MYRFYVYLYPYSFICFLLLSPSMSAKKRALRAGIAIQLEKSAQEKGNDTYIFNCRYMKHMNRLAM
jgi:hypothetical protein